MSYALRCPHCRGKFPWNPLKGMPDKCELCGERVGHDPDADDVVMPFIRTAKTSRTDQLYRDMERGSEVRMEKAAELTGTDPSDMAALKISDMRDNMRAGDIAAKEAEAAMARMQSTTRAPIGFAENGAEYGGGIASGAVAVNGRITTGIEPRAGSRAVGRVQRIMQGI